MTFLTIITRSYRRPELLTRNVSSVARQTWPDVEHIIWHDPIGHGIEWTHVHLRDLKPSGEYVMILDDDDWLYDDSVIAQLAAICLEQRPEVVVMQMELCGRVLPDEWPPRQDHIAVSCWAVTRAVWRAHVRDFGDRYAGDYGFFRAVLDCPNGHRVYRTSIMAARADRVSHGMEQRP